MRRVLAAAAGALLVCGLVAAVAGAHLAAARDATAGLTARAIGQVSGVEPAAVAVRWAPAGGTEREDVVVLAGTPPPVGTRVEVAHDPAEESRLLVPGAAVLADGDTAATTLALTGAVAIVAVVVTVGQTAVATVALRRTGPTLAVRRVRFQRGLLARSWLETENGTAWLPVAFDPVLTTVRSPQQVRLHGDPAQHRLVGATVDGVRLAPSGPVRRTEPPGRRTDNPTAPDARTVAARAQIGLVRHLRADAVLLAPVAGVAGMWTYVAGGGLVTFVTTVVLLTALMPLYAAVRGSDPT